jgi:hypothetical protein
MDKKLTFTKTHDLGKLNGELVAAIAGLASVDRGGDIGVESVFSLAGGMNGEIMLWVPDAVTEAEVQTVIDAHTP